MIEWKRLYAKPAGSLPGGVVTQWGVGAITVFILLFLTYWIWLGGGEPTQVAGLTETATTPPRSFAQQMTARVDAETMRAETNKAAEARALRAEQQRQANVAGLTATHQAAVLAGPSPDTGQPYTQQEWELRERLRLEAVERRSRSLRSSPVAQSYRKLDRRRERGQERSLPPTPHPKKMKAQQPCNTRLTQCTRSQTALKMKSRRSMRRIKRFSPHSAVRPPRRKRPRLFPPRLRPAPRRKITLFQRDSKRRKTLRAGSVSMKARF